MPAGNSHILCVCVETPLLSTAKLQKMVLIGKSVLARGIEFSPADHALRLSFVRHAVGNPAQVIRYLDASRFADAS